MNDNREKTSSGVSSGDVIRGVAAVAVGVAVVGAIWPAAAAAATHGAVVGAGLLAVKAKAGAVAVAKFVAWNASQPIVWPR